MSLLSPFATAPLLSEIERGLYITNSPAYPVFQTRVDEEFLKPFLAGYKENEAALRDFVAKLGEEIGLEGEELKNVFPVLNKVQTPQEFTQAQLF